MVLSNVISEPKASERPQVTSDLRSDTPFLPGPALPGRGVSRRED